MKKILVMFDCFGVLCDKLCSVFLDKHTTPELAAKITENLIAAAEIGEMSRDEFFDALCAELGMERSDVEAEFDSLTIQHKELVPVIEKIREFADVALLSNAYEGHAESVLQKFDLTKLFDKIFLSWQCKLAKPNPEFYLHGVKSFGKDYDEIYMVDDTQKNLDPLPAIGIIPIKYVTHESVVAALSKYIK